MTNYNERLDEILNQVAYRGFVAGQLKDTDNASNLLEQSEIAVSRAKQALTSLIKELVAEAKPEYISPDQPLGLKYQGRNEAIWEFEQNLLKALEEV